MPLIIGFCGHSGVGKDTSFLLLRESLPRLHVSKVAFADGVKAMSHVLFSHLGHREPSHYDACREDRYVKLDDIGKSPVEIWCALGDGVRDCVYQDAWSSRAIDQAMKSDSHIVCITDVRYPSEIDAIRAAGGIAVKVINDRVQPLNSNADHALDDWQGEYDLKLLNNSSPGMLKWQIKYVLVPMIEQSLVESC